MVVIGNTEKFSTASKGVLKVAYRYIIELHFRMLVLKYPLCESHA